MKLIVEIGVYVLVASVIILAMVAIVSHATENKAVPQFSFTQEKFNTEITISIYMFLLGLSIISMAIILIVVYFISPKKESSVNLYKYRRI